MGVGWNAAASTTAARGADDWFQPDGVHLYAPGAEALAALLHTELVTLGVAPSPPTIGTSRLPRARRGTPYGAELAVTGGLGPFRWSCRPALPRGIHLLADGRLTGVPSGQAQSVRVTVTVTDATGTMATRPLLITVS
jgi:hypothetical protein